MKATAPPVAQDRGPTPLERVLLGLLGIAVAAAALWFSGVVAFILIADLDCTGPHRGVAILEIAISWALGAAAATLPWLIAVSLLRVAAGRRCLRARAWIATALLAAIIAVPFAVNEAATTPPPNCQPLD